MEAPPYAAASVDVVRVPGERAERDQVAVEEPLEIRLNGRPVAVTMRTPGHDEELERIRKEISDDEWFLTQGRPDLSRRLFEQVALADDFVPFLSLPAYEAGRFEEARRLFEQVALADDFVDFLTLPAYQTVLATE